MPYLLLLLATATSAQTFTPADLGQSPAGGGTRLLPEQFLRGYDPVTAYFSSDQVAAQANADDGPQRLKIVPEWPGQWQWVDRRTLQFRPAEPWPALARFQIDAAGTRKVLTTMMSAPQAMAPSSGSTELKPFRVVTLTFPQAYPAAQLKKMLTLELRDLPGLADSPRRKITSYSLSQLPRRTQRDPATWAITLEDDVPEGKQLVVSVSLALGSEGTTLWQGRASTRSEFSLVSVRCGANEFSLLGGASTPKDLALGCGTSGDTPQLQFSAPVAGLTLTQLRRLVRLEPAVPDLHFVPYGNRVQLKGRFVPDTLYKMTLASAPIVDDGGRALREVKSAEVFFHLGWRAAFLRWNTGVAMVEANGPRMLPLTGYGEPRADVRVYRVDPLHTGLWPFPSSPVTVNEDAAPPFPGEEPQPNSVGWVDSSTLAANIRLLGSPLVSRVVDLPLADKSNTTHFGLDLKPLLDPVVGTNRPGTYLVGVRRLTGRPERSYMRVQVTNLSVTSISERGQAVLYVRRLDDGDSVKNATVVIDGTVNNTETTRTLTTDASGRVALGRDLAFGSIKRLSVKSGDDVLVFDPREGLPGFVMNHWSGSSTWLDWLTRDPPPPENDASLSFLFSERAIYKPGETVFLKGYLREKVAGELKLPTFTTRHTLEVQGPGGERWPVKLTTTPLGGFSGEFKEQNVPTGDFIASLYDGDKLLSRRSFKIEAYRIPTFEVQLAGPVRTRLDAAFKMKAVARYYAGGFVSNQPVTWNVTQRPYYWVPKGLDGFLFASSNQFSRAGANKPPQVINQQGELDDQGAGEIAVNPQLDLDGSARIYRFEATVTGPDEQQVTSASEVKALPGFVLGLKVPRFLQKASSISPQVVAVGVDDKPVKGQELTLKLMRRVWHSNLRETAFATGQAKYVTEQEDVTVATVPLVTAEGPVTKELPITESGVYVVELSARDKLGRVQTLTADLYIGGSTPQSWPKSRDGVFELKADKPSYAPGETAHLVVQSPYAQARALVVVEEPTGNTYAWRDVSGSKATLDVRITDRHTPNLPVHVVLMRGRLGEGKTDDTRYKPATVASSIDLEVSPVKQTVKVNVQHPELARPGTKQDFVITLADDRGAPLSGEVTFWLVDEAVLSLAKEATLDPLSELIRRNQRTSSIHDSRNLIVGRIAELEDDPGGDGAEGDGEGGKRRVRKNFKTVPYYAATLVVPASGKLTVPVTLSDDLTNFRVRAVAVSGTQRFGFKQSTLKVRLPVLVQPQLPRFVRGGDRFYPGAVARLVEGAEGPGTVDIALKGPVEATSLSGKKIDLKSNKAVSVLTPATVKTLSSEGELAVRVDVTRTSDKAGDAFEVKLPVLPDRPFDRFAYFDTLKPGANKLKDLPEPARPGTVTQRLVFTNQKGLLELASALEYLSAYPHGCLEQRMSQVSPDLALGKTLKQLELDTRFTPQLQANVKRIVDELGQHQDETGLFSFWPGGRGTVALTAQAVEFLSLAKQAGIAIDDKVRSRAIEALQRSLRSDFVARYQTYPTNDQTAALRALGRSGALDEHYAVEMFNRRSNYDVASVADLASAMSEKPQVFTTNLATLKTELWDSIVFKLVQGQKQFGGFQKERTTWDYGYLGSRIGTTATVFDALLRIDPADSRHALLRDALVAQANATTGFGNTADNRRAVAAIGTYLERAKNTEPRSSVAVPGTGELVLEGTKKAGRRDLTTDTTPSVSVSGGPVSMRAGFRYLGQTPGDAVPAKKDGFIVSRALTWYHADGQAPTHHDDEPGKSLKVKQGEVLEIEAKLVSTEKRHQVALVVPFAAGLEPLNPNLENASSDAKPSQADSTAAAYVQRLDHETRYYFLELAPGTHTFFFRVRATSEGSFVHPAPFAEMMYREEVRGRGNGTRIVVTGANEK